MKAFAHQEHCDEEQACEAVGCGAKALYALTVPVGSLGGIKIFVCENCCPKFKGSSDQKNGKVREA